MNKYEWVCPNRLWQAKWWQQCQRPAPDTIASNYKMKYYQFDCMHWKCHVFFLLILFNATAKKKNWHQKISEHWQQNI